MGQPSPSDLHVNRPLTMISIAAFSDPSAFVAGRVFPNIPVQKKTDSYIVFDQAYIKRNGMQKRAPGTESAGGGWKLATSPTYRCEVYAEHKLLLAEDYANVDEPIDLERFTTRWLTEQALINAEQVFMTNYMAGSLWTYDYDGVASSPTTNQVLQWNDASSTPIEDVWAARVAIMKLTGRRPNKLVIGPYVKKALATHPDFISRVQYGQMGNGQPSMVTDASLAALFEIDEVLTSEANYNTALEGATASYDFIAGKKALLVYTTSNPQIEEISAGYTFGWAGMPGAGPNGQRIIRLSDDHKGLGTVKLEIEHNFDMKLVSADCGAFWDSVVA